MSYDLNQFFSYSLDLLCIAGTDGYFKEVNPSFERVLGWSAEELLSKPFVEFIHPDDVEATLLEVENLSAGKPTVSFENRYRSVNGHYHHFVWNAYPEPDTGLVYAIARDITELDDANTRFRLALEASPNAMIMTDQRGIIRLVNEQTESLLGYLREELLGSSIEILVPDQFRQPHREYRTIFNQSPRPRPMGVVRDLVAQRKDGSIFPVEIGLNPIQIRGEMHVISSIIDLSARKEAEEQILTLAKEVEKANEKLFELATTDMLTGLKNRRAFEDQLGVLIRLAQRMKAPLSVVLLDVDRFKNYNDEYGHLAGDEVLKTLGVLLQRHIRESDLVARYGGEEFAVLLPGTFNNGAIYVADRMREAVSEHPWKNPGLTISAGVSTLHFGNTMQKKGVKISKRLLLEADRALYHSKNTGRDKTSHFVQIPTLDPEELADDLET